MEIYIIMILSIILFSFIYDICRTGKEIVTRNRTIVFWKRLSLLLVIASLLIPGILRYGIGTDYGLYSGEYYVYEITGYSRHDFGFRFLERLTQNLHLGFYGLIAITFTIFILGSVLLISELSDNLMISILLLIFSYNYFISYSLIAQYTALGCVCLFLKYMIHDKYVISLIWLFIAGSMHSSAYIFILVFLAYILLSKIKKAREKILLSSLLLLLLSVVIGKIAVLSIVYNTRFSGYINDASYSSLTSTSFVVINIITASYMVIAFLIKPYLKKDKLLNLMFLLQIIALIFSLLQGEITLIFRLIYYFSFFQIVSLQLFTKKLFAKETTCVMVEFLILISFIIWFILFPFDGDYYNTFPYISIFDI